jgi:hypothetical protein
VVPLLSLSQKTLDANKKAGRGGIAPPTTDFQSIYIAAVICTNNTGVRRSTAELPARKKRKTKAKKIGDKEGFAPSTYGTTIIFLLWSFVQTTHYVALLAELPVP